MDCHGKFPVFDFSRISTYPIAKRVNKVKGEDLIDVEELRSKPDVFTSKELDAVTDAATEARTKGKPLILFTGAHLVKNGFGPIMRDLIERKFVTLVAMNCAGFIHDFELALIGETSEWVPNALPEGEFGMATETGRYLNEILTHGEELKVGAGEAIARAILGESFPEPIPCKHPEFSFVARGFELGVPVTMHASIGTDIIDQHPNFNPSAKGGCSGRDFGIYCAEVAKLTGGGVVLNVGSAVTGPEVFLKACAMSANVGKKPEGIVTANFDMREVDPTAVSDERKASYYFRDNKSVVTRIPEAFNGKGYYVQGDHLLTVPALYQQLVRKSGKP